MGRAACGPEFVVKTKRRTVEVREVNDGECIGSLLLYRGLVGADTIYGVDSEYEESSPLERECFRSDCESVRVSRSNALDGWTRSSWTKEMSQGEIIEF